MSHPPNDNLIARGWNDPMDNLWNGTCTSTGLCTRPLTDPDATLFTVPFTSV